MTFVWPGSTRASDHILPRAVFCTDVGLFSRMKLYQAVVSAAAKFPGSVRLDVCCHSTVFVEGLGDMKTKCASLGNDSIDVRPIDAVPTVDGLPGTDDCGTGVMTDVTSAVMSDNTPVVYGMLDLDLECAAIDSQPDAVVDLLAVKYTASGVIAVQAIQRDVHKPAGHEIIQSVLQRVRSDGRENVKAAETDECKLPNNAEFVFVDVQCQGFPHDRCGCVDGHVRCITATKSSTATHTLPHFVSLAQLTSALNGVPFPWCASDGGIPGASLDVAEGWYLLRDDVTKKCQKITQGETALQAADCDLEDLTIRWRMLDVNARASFPGSNVNFFDSRLEAAALPGQCILVETPNAAPERAPCLTESSATPSAQIAGTAELQTGYIFYTTKYTLEPVTSYGDWRTDSQALNSIKRELRVMSGREANTYSRIYDLNPVYGGRLSNTVRHCDAWEGVVCNQMGRVVHLDIGLWGVQAKHPQPGLATVVLPLIVRMSELEVISLQGLDVYGHLPTGWQLPTTPSALRAIYMGNTKVNGTLYGDWNLASLRYLDLESTDISGPLPLACMALVTNGSTSHNLHVNINPPADGVAPHVKLCSPIGVVAGSDHYCKFSHYGTPLTVQPCDNMLIWKVAYSGAVACDFLGPCSVKGGSPKLLSAPNDIRSHISPASMYHLSCHVFCNNFASRSSLQITAASPSGRRLLTLNDLQITSNPPRPLLRDSAYSSELSTILSFVTHNMDTSEVESFLSEGTNDWAHLLFPETFAQSSNKRPSVLFWTPQSLRDTLEQPAFVLPDSIIYPATSLSAPPTMMELSQGEAPDKPLTSLPESKSGRSKVVIISLSLVGCLTILFVVAAVPLGVRRKRRLQYSNRPYNSTPDNHDGSLPKLLDLASGNMYASPNGCDDWTCEDRMLTAHLESEANSTPEVSAELSSPGLNHPDNASTSGTQPDVPQHGPTDQGRSSDEISLATPPSNSPDHPMYAQRPTHDVQPLFNDAHASSAALERSLSASRNSDHWDYPMYTHHDEATRSKDNLFSFSDPSFQEDEQRCRPSDATPRPNEPNPTHEGLSASPSERTLTHEHLSLLSLQRGSALPSSIDTCDNISPFTTLSHLGQEVTENPDTTADNIAQASSPQQHATPADSPHITVAQPADCDYASSGRDADDLPDKQEMLEAWLRLGQVAASSELTTRVKSPLDLASRISSEFGPRFHLLPAPSRPSSSDLGILHESSSARMVNVQRQLGMCPLEDRDGPPSQCGTCAVIVCSSTRKQRRLVTLMTQYAKQCFIPIARIPSWNIDQVTTMIPVVCGTPLSEHTRLYDRPVDRQADLSLIYELTELLTALHSKGRVASNVHAGAFMRVQGVPGWRFASCLQVCQQGELVEFPCSASRSPAAVDIRWLAPEQICGADGCTQRMIADQASDMFSLGLVVFQIFARRNYWDGLDAMSVHEMLLGKRAMPHDTDAMNLTSMCGHMALPVGALLQQDRAARPLAGELLHVLQQLSDAYTSEPLAVVTKETGSPVQKSSSKSGGIWDLSTSDLRSRAVSGVLGMSEGLYSPTAARSSGRTQRQRKVPSPTLVSQAVEMSMMLSKNTVGSRLQRSSVPIVKSNQQRVFLLEAGESYTLSLSAQIPDNACTQFPLEYAVRISLEPFADGGGVPQTLDLQRQLDICGGRGMLVESHWQLEGLQPPAVHGAAIHYNLHLTAKVKGLEEALIISKRVHFRICRPGTVPYKGWGKHNVSLLSSDKLARLTRDAGLHFEADIPVVG